MKIQYQKIENGLEILRIWQDSGIIKVPEQIEGIPVIRIAPYTFSLHKDEEEKNASVYQTETDEENDRFAQPEELCCGGIVREIHLPSTVQSIGNYAFYGCMNLKLSMGQMQSCGWVAGYLPDAVWRRWRLILWMEISPVLRKF